jgi:RND family efflux transporter MFP subunit
MGFVKELRVGEGDTVKKGELLYEIDSREIDSKKRQVELAIEMYKNQYMNVKLNLERFRRLYEKDMVAKYEVENLELAEKNLKNQVEIVKAQREEVLNQYKYLRIKAPNNGVIIAKNIKVGEMAMPGMPALILADLSDLKIITEVSESNLKYAKVGKEVAIKIPSIGLKKTGKIASIIPSSNPMTHKFKIKISFDYKGFDVYPGMYSEIVITK